MFSRTILLCGILFCVVVLSSPAQQPIDMLEVYARDEFRYGVQAFQRGLFNKSILSFEKSLSYKPDDILTKEWLGRAYFRSGFEDSAIDIWRSIIDANQGTALLRSKVETLEARRSLSRTLSTPGRYITAADVSSKLGQDNVLFRRPGSVLPQPNGGFYISAYGSNEILLFDINAALRQRFRGGLEGFDHPFDIIAGPGNTLLISEFEGNRVVQCTADGAVIKTWGKRGLSNGGLLGPQYLCLDDQGYFYVTDAGNRQVVKFDLEGDFVLAFGKKGSGYEGLKSPTGVAFRDGEVFVLDNARKNITVFDGSGNFIRSFGEGLFHSPEGISIMQDGSFLVADKDRIVKFFPDLETIEVVSDLSGKARRITSAVEDPNGNILAVDFDAETVSILSEITSMYAGLDVQIDSINTEKFPEVQITASVLSKYGGPIVGLKSNNFVLTERRSPAADFSLVSSVNPQKTADISVLLEGSQDMAGYKQEILEVLGQVYDAVSGVGSMRVLSSGSAPALEAKAGASRAEVLKTASFKTLQGQWKFDLGLRMAVTELLPFVSKKAVVFVTTGSLPSRVFGQYTVPELLNFMKNNHIVFYSVYLNRESPSEILEYLCRETGGSSHFVYQPQGLKDLISGITASRSGTYVFRYRSYSDPDFGRRYIPLELEALLFKKSGRDESGFFSGLDLSP